MKITPAPLLLFLLLIQASSVLPETQDAEAGMLEGVVLDSVTNLPVSGVSVSVRNSANPEKHCVSLPCPYPNPMATTDRTGRFAISGLKLASYRLTAWAERYIDAELGSNVTTNLGAPIILDSAREPKRLVIHISRAATVTGRILDDRGLPATNLSITAFKLVYNMDGFPTESSTKSVQTNDRGEYRLFAMAPGRYYFRVGSNYSSISQSGTPYTVTYYPNARSVDKASEIEVKAGSEVSLNWTVSREDKFTVSGRIIDDATGNPPRNAGLALAVCSELPLGMSLSASWHDPATGTFALPNVRPGQYLLGAGILNSNSLVPINSTERLASTDSLIEVKDRNIENVILRVAPPVSMSGKVVYEGKVTVPSNILAAVRIRLKREVLPATQCGSIAGTGPVFQWRGSEPEFRVDGLVVNRSYRVQATDIPPDLYIAKILYSGRNVSNGVITVPDTTVGSIEIVLHSGAGRIHGHVQNSDGSSAAGALTVLVPKQRDRRDLYKPAIVDASGQYSIEGITPGDYQIFSFITNDRYFYFNPRVIQDYEFASRDVNVPEFSNQAIELKVIPEKAN